MSEAWNKIIGGTYTVSMSSHDEPNVIFEFEGFSSEQEAYQFIQIMEGKIDEMFPRQTETVH